MDIQQDHLVAIQTGLSLKDDHLTDTAKIIALCRVLEKNTLEHVNIAQSFKDYLV